MITSTVDLGLKDLNVENPQIWEKIDSILKEKLNISLEEIKKFLTVYVASHAEELSLNLPNIAPYGDYSKLIEDNDLMADFLKNEAVRPENWILFSISDHETHSHLLRFEFVCNAINDAETLSGIIFISKAGIVRHAFVKVND
jgi:hypothetical protein